MTWLPAVILALVLFASMLAIAETAMSRMSRVRTITLREEGRRNAALLEQIQSDPSRYLNAIRLAVMFAQNGSVILVALLSTAYFGNLGVALVSVGFTVAYFVLVEAMSRTLGILHGDRAALILAPVVWLLGRVLAPPTRLLIGVANVLLPGKGLKQGPFVSEQDSRSMAEVGAEEAGIEETERKMIHSIFAFGGTLVGEIMVPRPDIVAIEVASTLHAALDTIVEHDVSRVPVYRSELDRVEGILYAKDAFKALHRRQSDIVLPTLIRAAHFVPKSKKASELLRQMQSEQFHMAIVIDEYGSAAGLVTLEDLLEEVVGEIADEHDVEERDVEPLGDGRYRLDASVSIHELNELLGTDFPRDRWNTVGGLMFGMLGTIPTQGQVVALQGFSFTAEKVQGRRVTTVLVTSDVPKDA
jgi:CBS domain containing-hemolysin-like protein